MQTNKPFLFRYLRIISIIAGRNLKELSDWFKNVMIRQDADIIERSARTFRWHFKEILLCILLAFLFAKVDKVQHFFTSFAIDIQQNQYSLGLLTAIFCFHGMFVIWLSYVFWHKPKKLKGKWSSLLGNRRDRSYEVQFNMPNGYWWIAVIATLPVVLVNVALSIALIKEYGYQNSSSTDIAVSFTKVITKQTVRIFLVAIALYLLLCILTKPRLRKNVALSTLTRSFRYRLLTFAAAILFFVSLLKIFFTSGCWSTAHWHLFMTLRCVMLIGFIYIPTLLLTHFWFITSKCLHHESEEARRILQTTRTEPVKKMDRYFDIFRYISYGFSCCIFLVLNQNWLSVQDGFSKLMTPVPVLLFVFIFYYQLWDFIHHNVTRIRRNIALATLLLSLILFSQREHYQMKFNGEQTGLCLNRMDIRDYFAQWAYKRFKSDLQQQDTTFYLVAAEGGGSRSGAWTASVLTELDAITDGRFRRNCFAISSVSGGSIGSAATLALWHNAMKTIRPLSSVNDSLYKFTRTSNDTLQRADKRYIRGIFRRNYVSTAIAGFFFYDFWQSVPLIHLLYPSHASRTDRQHDEENDTISKALHTIPGLDTVDYSKFFKYTSFLSLYYRKELNGLTQPTLDLPLFFPNTTRVEDGRRGIVSPVLMHYYNPACTTRQTEVFVSAVDVIGSAAGEKKSGAISFSEAAGLSQIFPYVNSNVRIGEKTGRFMDGGAYENMGLTTLYEIRRALANVCIDSCLGKNNINVGETLCLDEEELNNFTAYLKKIRFTFILIYNIDDHDHDDDIENKPSLQLLDPITALLKTPFSGHTDHMYHKLKLEIKDKIIEFPLSQRTQNSQYQQDIVMSRWLSKYEMDKIIKESSNRCREKFQGTAEKPHK